MILHHIKYNDRVNMLISGAQASPCLVMSMSMIKCETRGSFRVS